MSLLEAQHRVSTDSLADDLDVSRETVRRDLLELESEGLVKRVHGGAVLPRPAPEEPFKKRMSSQLRAKKSIAKCAATLIKPGQCIFIDAGTTTSVFAQELARLTDVLVLTNSIDIATTIHQSEYDLKVVLLGGQMVSDVPGTYGELTLSEIARFNADIAVMSPVALHPEHGAANFDLHEAEVARAMIAQSAKLMMLADYDKLGATSRVQYCVADQIDVLVTNKNSTPDQINAFTKSGVKKIIQAS